MSKLLVTMKEVGHRRVQGHCNTSWKSVKSLFTVCMEIYWQPPRGTFHWFLLLFYDLIFKFLQWPALIIGNTFQLSFNAETSLRLAGWVEEVMRWNCGFCLVSRETAFCKDGLTTNVHGHTHGQNSGYALEETGVDKDKSWNQSHFWRPEMAVGIQPLLKSQEEWSWKHSSNLPLVWMWHTLHLWLCVWH